MATPVSFGGHEPPRRERTGTGSSDRGFGIVAAIVFAVIGAWPVIGGGMPAMWSLGVAALLAGLALIRPRTLAPLNRLWTRFGLLLHRVVSPCVLAMVYYLAVTPIGLLRRLLGHDPLALRLDRAAASYWQKRAPDADRSRSMNKQF